VVDEARITALTVVTGVQVSGTDVQIKTRTISAIDVGVESGWTTIHSGTTCPSSGGS